MALLTTFLPKQHKNSNISIKILITYITFFERAVGLIDTLGGPHAARVFETPGLESRKFKSIILCVAVLQM